MFNNHQINAFSIADNDSELDELDPKSKRHLPNVTGIPEEEEEDELSGEIQKRLEEESKSTSQVNN